MNIEELIETLNDVWLQDDKKNINIDFVVLSCCPEREKINKGNGMLSRV